MTLSEILILSSFFAFLLVCGWWCDKVERYRKISKAMSKCPFDPWRKGISRYQKVYFKAMLAFDDCCRYEMKSGSEVFIIIL